MFVDGHPRNVVGCHVCGGKPNIADSHFFQPLYQSGHFRFDPSYKSRFSSPGFPLNKNTFFANSDCFYQCQPFGLGSYFFHGHHRKNAKRGGLRKDFLLWVLKLQIAVSVFQFFNFLAKLPSMGAFVSEESHSDTSMKGGSGASEKFQNNYLF